MKLEHPPFSRLFGLAIFYLSLATTVIFNIAQASTLSSCENAFPIEISSNRYHDNINTFSNSIDIEHDSSKSLETTNSLTVSGEEFKEHIVYLKSRFASALRATDFIEISSTETFNISDNRQPIYYHVIKVNKHTIPNILTLFDEFSRWGITLVRAQKGDGGSLVSVNGVNLMLPDRIVQISGLVFESNKFENLLAIPDDALLDEHAFLDYLCHQRQLILIGLTIKNNKVAERFGPGTKKLIQDSFEKHGVQVEVNPLGQLLGQTRVGGPIEINRDLLEFNSPLLLSTFLHELRHSTTNQKLTASSSFAQVSRAMKFYFDKSTGVPPEYTSMRADEFEARRIDVIASKYSPRDQKKSRDEANYIRELQIYTLTKILDDFENADVEWRSEIFVHPNEAIKFARVKVSKFSAGVPFPIETFNRSGLTEKAYLKAALLYRLHFLTATNE